MNTYSIKKKGETINLSCFARSSSFVCALKGTGSSLMVEPRNVATGLIRFSQLSASTRCYSKTNTPDNTQMASTMGSHTVGPVAKPVHKYINSVTHAEP